MKIRTPWNAIPDIAKLAFGTLFGTETKDKKPTPDTFDNEATINVSCSRYGEMKSTVYWDNGIKTAFIGCPGCGDTLNVYTDKFKTTGQENEFIVDNRHSIFAVKVRGKDNV